MEIPHCGSEPHIVIPEWMTPEQCAAVNKLFARNADGSPDRHAFFSRVEKYHGYCGLVWCNMFVGIEPDGYTHT